MRIRQPDWDKIFVMFLLYVLCMLLLMSSVHCGPPGSFTAGELELPEQYQYSAARVWGDIPVCITYADNIPALYDVVDYMNDQLDLKVFDFCEYNQVNIKVVTRIKKTKYAGKHTAAVTTISHKYGRVTRAKIQLLSKYSDHTFTEYILIHELIHALGYMDHIPGTVLRATVPGNGDFDKAKDDFQPLIQMIRGDYE